MNLSKEKIDQLAFDLAKDYTNAVFSYRLKNNMIEKINADESASFRLEYFSEFVDAYKDFADRLASKKELD